MINTRVSLSMDEILLLRAAIRGEIRNIDKLVEITGDPSGVKAEDKAIAEGVYDKLGKALKRI